MKKKYITPSMEIINQQPTTIICASGLKGRTKKDDDEEETIIDYGGESSDSGFDGID